MTRGKHVLQGAQNVIIIDGNINVAESVSGLSDASYYKLINWNISCQINYYTAAGNGWTAISVQPNSSIRFAGQTNVLAKQQEDCTAENCMKTSCAYVTSTVERSRELGVAPKVGSPKLTIWRGA